MALLVFLAASAVAGFIAARRTGSPDRVRYSGLQSRSEGMRQRIDAVELPLLGGAERASQLLDGVGELDDLPVRVRQWILVDLDFVEGLVECREGSWVAVGREIAGGPADAL